MSWPVSSSRRGVRQTGAEGALPEGAWFAGGGLSEALTARATARGLMRSDCTVSLFFTPWIAIGLPFIIAR